MTVSQLRKALKDYPGKSVICILIDIKELGLGEERPTAQLGVTGLEESDDWVELLVE